MAEFQIKVRNLETEETLIATLDCYEDALTWLQDRPRFVEVITVISDISPKQAGDLRAAMRPYDDDEKALMASHAAQLAEAVKRARETEETRAAADEKLAREAAKHADPNRPMKVRWTIDEGFESNDAYDERPITEAAQTAIIAWVQERNGWVADRGQFVAEAEVEVYPNEVPGGDEAERVLRGGKFIPRLRPTEA